MSLEMADRSLSPGLVLIFTPKSELKLKAFSHFPPDDINEFNKTEFNWGQLGS
jgi:hypothetical protein